MPKVFNISSKQLNFKMLQAVMASGAKLKLSNQAKKKIKDCRIYLEQKLNNSENLIYGINTGFGALCNKKISRHEMEGLQKNLVLSHACGTGDEIPADIVRMMLLLKIQSLSYGHSGVTLALVKRLIDLYNNDIIPVVYELGSLGASGDLAPLAHLSLPLIGLGEVYHEGKRKTAAAALKQLKLQPLTLKAKEGLALLNGTQMMSAYGSRCLIEAEQLSRWADTIAALSLDAFDGRQEPFDALLHQVRPHTGQIDTAKAIKQFLRGSELTRSKKEQVQDPYSFRCIPQVHGACKDNITYISNIFQAEINSVTDNPIIYPKEDKILSGGNFHGEGLAMALDQLAITLAELGSISERRTYQLLSGQRGLPEFLIAKPGLHSGLMILQYTAAAIVSQNKQLATPASVDTIVSSNGQEDHVSMGANAATKAYRAIQNLKQILAIELITAAQAMEFRRPKKTSGILEKLLSDYRKHVKFVQKDRVLSKDIETSVRFMGTFTFSK